METESRQKTQPPTTCRLRLKPKLMQHELGLRALSPTTANRMTCPSEQQTDYQANSPAILTVGLLSFNYFFLLNFFFILSDFLSLTFLILTFPVRVLPLSSVVNWSFLAPSPL